MKNDPEEAYQAALINSRPLSSPSDIHHMASLAAQFPDSHFHIHDLPYRLTSWALDDPANACLWFVGEELVAWAVMQTPWWTVDYACHPQHEVGLHAHILAWADARARALTGSPYARPRWFAAVFSGQTQRIRDLEAAGFACQVDVGANAWAKVLMRREAKHPLASYAPPPGYVVRSLAGLDEAEAYVALHQAVFESKTMTLPWRQRAMQHPAYLPELDVVVAAPDGQLAAFCVCWLSHDGKSGQVEPLGCHKDYRRFALGRVALVEGLRRLLARGVEQIYVETDHYRNTAFRLYESFNFEVIQDVLIYRKDYPESH